MKRQPSKAQIRDEIDEQIRDFIERGGAINEVERGITGIGEGTFSHRGQGFEKPRSERTPIPQVVAAIEARRKSKSTATTAKSKTRRPRKKVIYDDFGEPIRWVWVDE